jgi:microcystin-dependent protein
MKRYLFATVLVAITIAAPLASAQEEQFLGEIRFVAFNFAPVGWAQCNGQLLPISQYTPLFSLLGTTYGGDGKTTFALPNLQGRVPIHESTTQPIGQSGGQSTVTLTVAQMPKHRHNLFVSTAAADSSSPADNVLADSTDHPIYSSQKLDANLRFTSVSANGGGEPFSTMPPYLTLNCIIALQGIFPSRN